MIVSMSVCIAPSSSGSSIAVAGIVVRVGGGVDDIQWSQRLESLVEVDSG
jgi:hypothetical protein